MALQQEHSPNRPKTKVDSYEDPSQVALSEDPNSIRFAKDSSKFVLFSPAQKLLRLSLSLSHSLLVGLDNG